MSEVKAGDRVRITTGMWDYEGSLYTPGTEGVVAATGDTRYPFYFKPDNSSYPVPVLANEVELIEEEDHAVEVDGPMADEVDVAAILRLLGVDVTDEEMETAVDLAILLGSARDAKEANNE